MLLDEIGADAFPYGCDDEEHARQLAGVYADADGRRDLLLVDEPPIERRAARAAQHVREELEALKVVIEPGRSVIRTVDAGLRHGIVHLVADVGIEPGHPSLQPIHGGAWRNAVEVLLDELERLFRGDVTREREDAVVRAVIRAVPPLHVLQTRSL